MKTLMAGKSARISALVLVTVLATLCGQAVSQELDLSPGNKLILRTNTFQSDSDTLDQGLIESLNRVGDYLLQRPDMTIEVVGHSDSTGQTEYNDDLAIRRAQRVKRYLMSTFSIKGENIITQGVGSRFPLASNETEEGRSKNRRVEIYPVTTLTKRALTGEDNKPKNEEGQLSYFNGTVQTKAPWQIGFGDAFLKEPIYEMHKINTQNRARAEVTFNDESRLQVGQNSLVVIYGRESKEPAIKEKGNIELVKGDLLAKLHSIRTEQRYVVKTPSAQMTFPQETKSKLAVDQIDRSTISVFEGSSEVKAAEKTVDLPENYGTQVYRNSPPEDPRRLPDPPVVLEPTKTFLPWFKEGVTFSWKPMSVASKLEVSTDTNFNSLKWAVTTRKTSSKANLEEGVYYWHLQSIDSVGLEGKPTDTRILVIKKYDYERARLDLQVESDEVNVVNKPDVALLGTTSPGSMIRINGERIRIDQNGMFSYPLHLIEGENMVVVEARDTLGFENSKTVHYRYEPSRKFGLTLGFSPLVLPNRYGSLKVGGDISVKLPQLFSSSSNFGINLTVGEFLLSSDSVSGKLFRPYGLAELLLTVESSEKTNVVPFMEVTSGALLWPKYNSGYYTTTAGIAYEAGLGIGLRSNGPSSAFGALGMYRWIVSDYHYFDPRAKKGIHGLFDLQLAYYFY